MISIKRAPAYYFKSKENDGYLYLTEKDFKSHDLLIWDYLKNIKNDVWFLRFIPYIHIMSQKEEWNKLEPEELAFLIFYIEDFAEQEINFAKTYKEEDSESEDKHWVALLYLCGTHNMRNKLLDLGYRIPLKGEKRTKVS